MSRLLILATYFLSFLILGVTTDPTPTPVSNITVNATEFQESKINWLTWEEAMELMKVEKKKVLVDIYTDWCGWCKRMDKTTFADQDVAEYINENYYAIKFNAEYKEPIQIGEKVYKFIKSTNAKGRGHHELALELTMGRLSYPSFVFLNEDGKIIQAIPGYKDVAIFEKIMTYFGEDYYQSVPWQKYQDDYVPLNKKEQEKKKDATVTADPE